MPDALHEAFENPDVEYRLCDDVLCPGFDLPIKSLEFLVKIDCTGIGSDTDKKSGRVADRIAGKIESVVQSMDEVHKTDGIDIEDRSCVGPRPSSMFSLS